MEYKDITNLIKLIQKSNLSEFKLKEGDFEILIKTDKYVKRTKEAPITLSQPIVPAVAAPSPSAGGTMAPQETTSAAQELPSAKAEDSSNYLQIKSPIVGTFYRSASPDADPYVKVGDRVEAGSVVCIVEAMKLFNEIESEISGTIVQMLVEDATPVEYDQPLFLVDPN